jgi:UDP-GlcNAc:undecaprenyl-phosphate/decaprenyl-phosphate GlcNAc-1-phosphate transferase
MLINFLLSVVISSLISFIATPIIKRFFISHSWVEDPITKQQKTQNATALTVVPRGGGLPIYLAIVITSFIFLPFDKHLSAIMLASLLTLIVGLWDDIKDISPKLRLSTNLLAALIVVASGIGIAYISNPLGGIIDLSVIRFDFNLLGPHSIWLLSDLLAILWIIWCMNITGWSAGIEGQLPGFVSISAIFIGILGLRYASDATQWPVIILAGAVAGSYLGFLPFNFSPQSIMVGYSGKSLAGFFLAVLAILSGAKLATLILLLGIPMIDAVFVIARRAIRHKSLLRSDGQHLHHRLLKIGWTRPQIAVFYWLISMVLGIISLFLNSQQKMYVFIGLFILFFGFLIQLYFTSSKDKEV